VVAKLRVIADLHIHSRYSRATSENMNLAEIERFAQIKGLSLVGSGDFTHPSWMKELKDQLKPLNDTGLYALSPSSPRVSFMITAECCTIFEYKGRTRKIHHVVLSPSIEVAEQIIDSLGERGNLSADGRPILNMSAAELVDAVVSTSPENLIFPAHAWTPWFSIFGANSGFDSIAECYGDTSDKIFALETGLSSDPRMNWRISGLDRYALVSNSDSHSAWPWRMGREANVFDIQRLTFREITDAIKSNDSGRFKFTIETDPAYGKYHWTGHRDCGVSLSSQQAISLGNICPKCHRRLTKGVEQRVEELADRPPGYQPEGAPGFVYLLPLSEVIAAVEGVEQPSSPKVWRSYNSLIAKFGNEYGVLLDSTREMLDDVVDPRLTEAIIMVRENRVKVVPGYDGVYGKIELLGARSDHPDNHSKNKTGLDQFM